MEQYKLRPFANMLDAGGSTTAAYNVPRNSPSWLTVIDGSGKIIYNASKGWYWSGGPNDKRLIHHTQIEKSLREFPDGILGLKEIPADMETAAHYYDLQQFGLLEVELRKAEAKSAPPASKAFAETVRARMAESRMSRRDQIAAFSATDPVQAYREAIAFTAAFPNAPERAAVNEMGQSLVKQPAVKREMEAEAVYQQMLVPELKKTTTLDRYVKNVQPLLEAYLRKFGTTQYGAGVKNACDAHRAAVSAGEK